MYDHFLLRMKERYDIRLTKKDVKGINESIRGGKTFRTIFHKKVSNRISLWFVLIKNIWTMCYYDRNKHSVVTCKSPDKIRKLVKEVTNGR